MSTKLLLTILLFTLAFVHTEAQQTTTTFNGAFQSFEGGYMMWWGDDGTIWVLYDNGTTRAFAESAYATLPDNPVADTAPPNRMKPVAGFGRVWGNFPEVRGALGWALEPEIGYMIQRENVALIGNGAIALRVNFPDGREVFLRDDNTWLFTFNSSDPTQSAQIPGLSTPIPTPGNATRIPPLEIPPVSSVYTHVAYQSFEGGFMLYFSDSGAIWVLYENGSADSFSTFDYGALPPNPIITPTPMSFYLPVLGFGRVWGHFDEVRYRLGWAITPEETYVTLIQNFELEGGVMRSILALPDGRQIELETRDESFWQYITSTTVSPD